MPLLGQGSTSFMQEKELEDIERTLLLEAIFLRYGYDFRNYSQASISRRVRLFLEKNDVETIGELLPRIIREPELFQGLLFDFSVTVTEMFRDPPFYRALRREVVPLLKTYPFIKVWSAGCATGEEVYSLAILLKEEGLLHKSTIFATDINDSSLAKAKRGIYPLKQVREYIENFQETGSMHSFSRYYHANEEHIVMERELRGRITFANHNLVADQVFGEMHLILCRNVMIYFDKKLQNMVLDLFDQSLIRGGFLCLGGRESLRFSNLNDRYEELDSANRIYRKHFAHNHQLQARR
ncbi:MAG: protein-glutamate O-methyltransferase CheR [Candidatus Electrothrix scaldis]|nr:protein-glutamate O-methyltransferase CheR [Candidatus Electrothrix aestuarii]WPD24280.1 MAG: protein-glutamate O-methyltransferase CheR [Candidatus Electrothrix sp. GW3-3]